MHRMFTWIRGLFVEDSRSDTVPSTTTHISDLPDELLVEVFVKLNRRDVMNCRKVSRRFRQIIDKNFSRPYMEINLCRQSIGSWADTIKKRFLYCEFMPSSDEYSEQPIPDEWTLGVSTSQINTKHNHPSRTQHSVSYKGGKVTMLSKSIAVLKMFQNYFKTKGYQCSLRRSLASYVRDKIIVLEVIISSFDESLSQCLFLCVDAGLQLTLNVSATLWSADNQLFVCLKTFMDRYPGMYEKLRLKGHLDPTARQIALTLLQDCEEGELMFEIYYSCIGDHRKEPYFYCLKLRRKGRRDCTNEDDYGNSEFIKQQRRPLITTTAGSVIFNLTADIHYQSNLYEVLSMSKLASMEIELTHYAAHQDKSLIPALLKKFVGEWVLRVREIKQIRFIIYSEFGHTDSGAFLKPGVQEILEEHATQLVPKRDDKDLYEETFIVKREHSGRSGSLVMHRGRVGIYRGKGESFTFTIEENYSLIHR